LSHTSLQYIIEHV